MGTFLLENTFIGNKYFIEFLENLILILVILTTGNFLLISIVLVSCIYLAGAVTTGNPAVIFALYLANKISSSELFFYLIAEIFGCLIGFFLYYLFFKKK